MTVSMGRDKKKNQKSKSIKFSGKNSSVIKSDKKINQEKFQNTYSSINYNYLSRDEWHWLD